MGRDLGGVGRGHGHGYDLISLSARMGFFKSNKKELVFSTTAVLKCHSHNHKLHFEISIIQSLM